MQLAFEMKKKFALNKTQFVNIIYDVTKHSLIQNMLK